MHPSPVAHWELVAYVCLVRWTRKTAAERMAAEIDPN